MAIFQLTIPDELLPALVAEYAIVSAAGSTTASSPEEYFAASVVETVRQRAEIYKVGPYYAGPVDPQFNADGTPYGQPEPTPEVNWEWPDAPERFDTFTAPDGSEWVYDQPRAEDGTYATDDPATEVVESALQWLPALVDGTTGGEV